MGQAESAAGKEVTLQNIQELYRRFASECPSGNLHFHEFRRIFGVSSSSTEESAYMEIVFRSFDTNKVKCCVLSWTDPGGLFSISGAVSLLGWQNRLHGVCGCC